MGEQKKKKIKIAAIAAMTVAGIAIATVTGGTLVQKKVTSGTVGVESINLKLYNQAGEETDEIADWEPGDVDMVKWKVKNNGTAAVYTRNILRVYWNEEVYGNNQYIFLYPANMSKQDILEDYKKGSDSEYAIEVRAGDIKIDDTTTKRGIEYSFMGDSLDGLKMTVNSTETNYNSPDFEATTDDSNAMEDDIAFNILLSPDTTYMYGGKTLTVDVVTEAMQHTEDGRAEWSRVSTQTLGR